MSASQVEQEWEGLRTALEKLALDHEHFCELSLRQRTALIENRVDDLNVVLVELETLADGIFQMDTRRKLHMERLADFSGSDVLNLKDLAGRWSQLDIETLEAPARRIRKARTQIASLTQTNTALIQNARQLNHAMVVAMVRIPSTGAMRSNKVYGSNGATHRTEPAVRNIINRRG